MDGGEEAVRKVSETIRRTYEQLVTTRNAQLRYMTSLRQRNKKEFAFLLTPDLILQYNYVHQLMKSFHSGMPRDICVEDGGITCSNLSVLKPEQVTGGQLESFPATLPTADGSDYLASRIVDLLDRPVTIGDQDLTLNVRDDFAANIRTLNLLFEERYKTCQEQGGRLRTELSTVKQQLVASRSVGAEAAARTATDQTIQRMREQITRYEIQLRVVREQMEAMQEMNENAIQRNQRDLEGLMQRMTLSGPNESSEAYLQILYSLFNGMETERDRLLAAIQQIQLTNDQRSREFAELMAISVDDPTTAAGNAAGSSDTVFNQVLQQTELAARVESEVAARVESELTARVETELAARTETEIARRVETEVNSRWLAMEGIMNARLDERIKLRENELQQNFDEAVAEKVAQAIGTTSLQVVGHDQISQMLNSTYVNQPQSTIVDVDADLKKYKAALDSIFQLKESTVNIVPMRSQYDLPNLDNINRDYELMNAMYEYIDYLLKKMTDMYKFLVLQSGYLYNLGASAYQEKVQLLSMTRQRTNKFNQQVDAIMKLSTSKKTENNNQVISLLNRILEELPKLKLEFEKFYKSRNFYNANEKWFKEKDEKISDLRLKLERCRDNGGELSRSERVELKRLRLDDRQYKTTVRELQLNLQSCREISMSRSDPNQKKMVKASDAHAQLKLEQSFRSEQQMEFRRVYNDMVNFVIEVGSEYQKWFRKNYDGYQEEPFVYKTFDDTLKRLIDEADRTINYGNSPRKDNDLLEKSVAGLLEGTPYHGVLRSNKSRRERDRQLEPSTRTDATSVPRTGSSASSTSNNTKSPSATSKSRRRQDRWSEN